MSYWKTLLIWPALLYGVAEGSSVELEQEISDALMKQLVEFVSIGMQETKIEEMEFSHSGKPYVHNLSTCYAMAWLYKNSHPLNPYYGKIEIRDEAIAYCDCMAEKKLILEWPMYAFCQVYDLLRDELPEAKKRLWRDYAGYYISTRGKRPYFYTSFNHEAYNALAVLRAGQVFNNREWEQQGRGLMRQLIKIQTEPGNFKVSRIVE